VQIRRLRPDAMLPRYQTPDAAGMDLHAALDGPMNVAPGAVISVPTGVSMAIPRGFEGQVRPRSGLAAKHAVTVVNAPGTIDADYRGAVMVLLINHGREPFTISHGDRIAQLVIAPVSQAELLEVSELDQTERGAGGFGSTGR
jgi:dUTP pyrophosphatase